ncbi:MAG: molybdopterin-guanine dinucleotide biosynthesis protein B [Candidatus Bipolaricaulia bacterium]
MDSVLTKFPCPVVSIIGHKNMGKTTLMQGLISHWTQRGLRVGALKHTHHGFQMDRDDTDSRKFQRAGAIAVGVVGPTKVAYIEQLEKSWEAEDILNRYFQGCQLDFLLLEGFKSRAFPKIEVYRPEATTEPPLALPGTLALVTTAVDSPALEGIECEILPFEPVKAAKFIEKAKEMGKIYRINA